MDDKARHNTAMGLIETRGWLPLVRAVDAALKAAQVSLTTRTRVGGGLANATVRGEVAAVRAALEAAGAVISQMGVFGMTQVIARPDSSVWAMLAQDGLKVNDPPDSPGGGPAGKAAPPAVKPRAEVPVIKPKAEAPVIKPDSAPPALKPEAEAPDVNRSRPAPAGNQTDLSGPGAKPRAKPKKPRKPVKK